VFIEDYICTLTIYITGEDTRIILLQDPEDVPDIPLTNRVQFNIRLRGRYHFGRPYSLDPYHEGINDLFCTGWQGDISTDYMTYQLNNHTLRDAIYPIWHALKMPLDYRFWK
jgi:hypothetical protein